VDEEVGIRVGEVTYFGSQPWPLPASLMLGFTGKALTTDIHVDGSEIEEARWWTRDEFEAAARSGELLVPRGISISSSLIETWFGRPLDGPGWG
jgi:NAD+ diphosphatase